VIIDYTVKTQTACLPACLLSISKRSLWHPLEVDASTLLPPKNDISIGSAVLARLTVVTNTQTAERQGV